MRKEKTLMIQMGNWQGDIVLASFWIVFEDKENLYLVRAGDDL